MIKKLFLALTIVLISASPAWAENWYSIGVRDDGSEMYIDTNSISFADDFPIPKEWVIFYDLVNYPTLMKEGYLSAKVKWSVWCKNGNRKILEYKSYSEPMGTGDIIQKWSNPDSHPRENLTHTLDKGDLLSRLGFVFACFGEEIFKKVKKEFQ